jgi:hypothetical protein
MSVVGVLSDDEDPMVSVMKVEKVRERGGGGERKGLLS